jgi:hypothetical protein
VARSLSRLAIRLRDVAALPRNAVIVPLVLERVIGMLSTDSWDAGVTSRRRD